MYPHQDHFICELSPEAILEILKAGAWQTGDQTITSAITNDNSLEEPDVTLDLTEDNTEGPCAFADIEFDRTVKTMLDVGGGQYDGNRNYMRRERDINLLVWDPYNRSCAHNKQVEAEVDKNKVDAATSMSVLNVIQELKARLMHINTLKEALKIGGRAYFKIWPGEFPLRGTSLSSSTNDRYQANAFADRFLREVEVVFGVENAILHETIPNLIVAVKSTNALIEQRDIIHVQEKAKRESLLLAKIRTMSMQSLYSKTNLGRLVSTDLLFFRKMEKAYLENERHSSSELQHQYDVRYGLVLRA